MNPKDYDLRHLVAQARYHAHHLEGAVADLTKVQDEIEKLSPGWTIKLETNLVKVQAQLEKLLREEVGEEYERLWLTRHGVG